MPRSNVMCAFLVAALYVFVSIGYCIVPGQDRFWACTTILGPSEHLSLAARALTRADDSNLAPRYSSGDIFEGLTILFVWFSGFVGVVICARLSGSSRVIFSIFLGLFWLGIGVWNIFLPGLRGV